MTLQLKANGKKSLLIIVLLANIFSLNAADEAKAAESAVTTVAAPSTSKDKAESTSIAGATAAATKTLSQNLAVDQMAAPKSVVVDQMATPVAAAAPVEEQSLSDAILEFKKAENQRRTTGFRHKDQVGKKQSLTVARMAAQNANDLETVAQASDSKEVRRQTNLLSQIKAENKRLEREILSLMGEPLDEDRWTDLGTPDITPAFPGFARIVGKNGHVHAELNFSYSSWFFNDQSKVVDLAQKIVGYQPVSVQDLLLIARLARKSSVKQNGTWFASNSEDVAVADRKPPYLLNDVTFSNISSDIEAIALGNITADTLNTAINNINSTQLHNTYFNRLADKALEFKADQENLVCNLNFSQVLNKVYTIGVEVPLVFQSNKLAMLSELTLEELVELQNIAVNATSESGKFFTRYPSGMKDFWLDILNQKGFVANPRSNLFGIGDVSLIINRKINAPSLLTAGVVGLGITAPSGVKTDPRYVWPAQLGNGGFWELRGHTSLFWRNSAFFNPHVFAQVRYRVPSTVQKRIARIVTQQQARSRDNDGQKANDLPLGSGFVYNSSSKGFVEAESSVPGLAQRPLAAIEINRGLLAQVRVGNLFNHVVFDNAYLDVYYQAEFEQEDSLSFRSIDPDFDTNRLLQNTKRHSHLIAATYCYQMSDSWQLEASAKHTFWGQNTARALEFSAGILYNF